MLLLKITSSTIGSRKAPAMRSGVTKSYFKIPFVSVMRAMSAIWFE